MNLKSTLLLTGLLLSAFAVGQEVVTVNDAALEGGITYNWTADKTYLLDGLVYLEDGGKLNIAAGTVIKGKESPTTGDMTSALIITRGAQIFAEGTADAPIVFTAEADEMGETPNLSYVDDKGQWGGLIILGRADIATTGREDGIEGIDADEVRAKFGGKDSPDNEDNSGTLKYVSIRYGGSVLSDNNEINGLTLGGVGSGTTIDYVEVFANKDDGIEFFGGTVSIKHAAVAFCGDDSFDYDYGWRGTGQFWFSLQADGDDTGRSGEHDGASPDEFTPFSKPNIANATYIGIGQGGAPVGNGDAAKALPISVIFRDNAAGTYQNSIFYDFNGVAIAVEDLPERDVDSYARLLAGDLVLKNNYFFGFGAGAGTAADIFVVIDDKDNINAAASAELVARMAAAGNLVADPLLNSDDRSEGGAMLDIRPNLFGASASGAPAPDSSIFDTVSYYGAFAPGNGDTTEVWITGWTALDQAGAFGITTGVNDLFYNGVVFSAPVPNPAYSTTRIDFEIERAGEVTVAIIDLLGRPVVRKTRNYGSGKQSETLDVTTLPNGTYFVILDVQGRRLIQKLAVKR